MAKGVLIGGGTGFIGSRLNKILTKNGYKVSIVSRMPGCNRITWHNLEEFGIPKDIKAVVNLAGQNVLDPTRRWTPGFKQNVWNSRINSTAAMVRAISKQGCNVKCFVNISGVSHYKPNSKIYTEDDEGENYDFMSKLCIEWEKNAKIPKDVNCRMVQIRTGVVVGRGGGMVQSITVPFWLGFGGPMGSGKQPLPWIHLDDLCHLIQYSIENEFLFGVLNGVAPETVTNAQFSKTFAASLHRWSIIPVPEIVVNAIFGKERSAILLTGAKIQPKKTLASGFKFIYPTVKSACEEVVKKL